MLFFSIVCSVSVLSVIFFVIFKDIKVDNSSPAEKYLREIRDYERYKFFKDLDGR